MPTFTTERTFTTRETAKIIGAPLSTVDRWAAIGVFAVNEPTPGRGRSRQFTFKDVVFAAVTKRLADHAVPIELVRIIIGKARESWPGDDPADAGTFICSPDGGTVALGGAPEPFGAWPAGAKELTAWAVQNDGKPSGLGEILLFVNVSDIARRIRGRIEELDRG